MIKTKNMDRSPFSILQTIAWCAQRITILEAVADHVNHYRSPAIQAALGQITDDLQYCEGRVLHGYDVSYGLIGSVTDRVRALAGRLRQSPKHKLGAHDPAFEIVRHLRNRWYGRKQNDAYPNEIAEQVMDQYPVPYYLK